MDYDICIIGGGVNGTAIARDAAGRGLSVLLVEAQDLASATSSASTKLVHGGLRYLEQYEFKLVRASLLERDIMLSSAPHIIWPMRFVLPHDKHLRPYRLIQLGLKLYDFLGGKFFSDKHSVLKKSDAVDFATDALGDPLHDDYARGFSYADCWVEDSRLVALNAVDAYERGAVILPRTACVMIEPSHDQTAWDVTLQDTATADQFQVKVGQVINAAGPWVRDLLDNSNLTSDTQKQKDYTPRVRLVKGSHIIVPRLYDGAQSYILQQPDGRIIFAIPYEYKYTLIGTTDKPFDGDAANVIIDDEEIEYLCTAINSSFKNKITKQAVVSSYSGVRSLLDDGEENASEVTRDYKIFLDKKYGPPLLSIFGGKITTARKLAEEVVNRLSTFYPDRDLKLWTEYIPLPGGDIANNDFDAFLKSQSDLYTFLPKDLLYRYARAYGTRISGLIGTAKSLEEMGDHYGDHVYEAEILYLIRYEFASSAEDILWRRSKLGLHISKETNQLIERALPTLITKVKGEGAQ